MKKSILMTAFLSSAIFANVYIGVEKTSLKGADTKILDIQPIDELIGKDLDSIKVSFGYEAKKEKGNILSGSRFGSYLETSDSKYNSFSGGVDFLLQNNNLTISPYFSGFIGLGVLSTGEDEIDVSTSVNKANYITTEDLNSLKIPTTLKYEGDTPFLEYGFGVGLLANFKNIGAHIGYKMKARSFQFDYRLSNSPDILNSISEEQHWTGFEAGISISF